MRLTMIFAMLLIVVVSFCNTLVVVRKDLIELYDVSIPLIPTRISLVGVANAIKVLPKGMTLYGLSEKSVFAYSYDQTLKNVELTDGAVDFTILEDGSIFVLSRNRLYLYDSTLTYKNTFTFGSNLVSVSSYKNLLVTLDSAGRITGYSKSLSKIWEISGSEPFTGIQISGEFLYAWSKSRFYRMKFNENVPVLESNVRLTIDVKQVDSLRNGLVLLDSKGTLWLVTQNDLRVLDKLDIRGKSFSTYSDYLYVTIADGTVQVVNVLFTTLKSLLNFGADVRATAIAQITRPTQLSQIPQQPKSSSVQSEPTSTVSKRNYIELERVVDLPYEIVSSCVIGGSKIYALSMTGEVMIADINTGKVESRKIGFIITADPVLLKNGQLVFGSWDKAIYVVAEKTDTVKVDATISIAGAATPEGFCITTDEGKFYFFSSSGRQLGYAVLNGWVICPPAAHEDFGVVVLDWLGVLKLIDFAGKERWSVILQSGKQAKVALARKTVFISIDERLYAVDLNSGSTLWAFQSESPFRQLTAVQNDLYALDVNGTVFCLDHSGKQKWKETFENGIGMIATSSGYLILVTSNEVILLNQSDGKIVYKEQLPKTAAIYPVLSDFGYLVVPSKKALMIYKVDDTPQKGWSMHLKDAFNSGLLTREDM